VELQLLKIMHHKNYFRYILFAGSALLFCLYSCLERIDINTKASAPHLVIYGYITTDTTQHAIRITRSSGYFATTKPEGISNANVSISYDGGVFVLNESSEEPGLYLTSSDVYGIPGKTYTLRASLDFNNDGKTEGYEATSYLPFAATLDSAAIIPSTIIRDHLQVLVWGRLPEEENGIGYSFHLYRNDTMMNDSLRGFRIFLDRYIVNKRFAGLPIWQLDPERSRHKILKGDTLTVQMESITTEYATFIENAQQEMFGPIPIFGGPPANIATNIRCLSPNTKTGISGFFTAFSKHRTATIYE
jgi:hypothetical protein